MTDLQFSAVSAQRILYPTYCLNMRRPITDPTQLHVLSEAFTAKMPFGRVVYKAGACKQLKKQIYSARLNVIVQKMFLDHPRVPTSQMPPPPPKPQPP